MSVFLMQKTGKKKKKLIKRYLGLILPVSVNELLLFRPQSGDQVGVYIMEKTQSNKGSLSRQTSIT